MKTILLLSAIMATTLAAAQTDTLPDKNNPAQPIASPNADAADKSATAQREPYKIETEKNAETVQKIKQRSAERKQKNLKKYKGKKSDTTKIKE